MQVFDYNSEKLKRIMNAQFSRIEKTVSKAVGLTPSTISLDKRHIVCGVLTFSLDEIEDRNQIKKKVTRAMDDLKQSLINLEPTAMSQMIVFPWPEPNKLQMRYLLVIGVNTNKAGVAVVNGQNNPEQKS